MGSFSAKAKSSSTFCNLWLPKPTPPTANRHNLCNPTLVVLVIGALLIQQGPNSCNKNPIGLKPEEPHRTQLAGDDAMQMRQSNNASVMVGKGAQFTTPHINCTKHNTPG
jgi:hypothetical protein